MIRSMTIDDLPSVCSLENQCFESEAWSEESFRYEIENNPFSKPVVLETEEGIVGYAIYWIMFEQAQLASIAVSPAFRQKGYGKQMLEHLIEDCHAAGCEWLSLEVRVSNTAAKTMYEKAGFTPLHTVAGYYSDGEDALVMGLGI